MPRRKPVSGKQRKAELQVKRAVKRGDAPAEAASSSRGSSRGRGGVLVPRRGNRPPRANIDASRRLESSFVKFSPTFLEDAKRKASNLSVKRPIPPERCLFSAQVDNDNEARRLTVPKRPKWRYDMSKKEVESNEAATFKRWLDETDLIIQAWKAGSDDLQQSTLNSRNATPVPSSDSQVPQDDHELMPYASPLFERNLEVWRQLWRVVEICEVLLVLVDSRCPTLHYPPSLNSYLSSYRPPRKVIFVLTKVDITGSKRAILWKNYLLKTHPNSRVVTVESYIKKSSGEGQGKRIIKEPHIPGELRADLVNALREAHNELCTPPLHISSDAVKLANWKPAVVPNIDWDAVLNAENGDITHDRPLISTDVVEESSDPETVGTKEFLSVGLIGQPNVGKSSLLNALFGRHKVKASKTPGKTKHFQTLFWSKQIRLVDCPGLVFPGFVDLEMQVLAGILPISQIPAIPSSTYHALQYLPLEDILALQHPEGKDGTLEDRRTWRSGMQPRKDSRESLRQWTAMDVLTAFAEKNGWITAKAGRPDVNRAGNYILRILAEGRIRWAFYPPDTDVSTIASEDKGQGIWIRGEPDDDNAEDAFCVRDDESDHSTTGSEEDDIPTSESADSAGSQPGLETGITASAGMFSALTLEDDGTQGGSL